MNLRQHQLNNIRRCSERLRKLSALYDKLQVLAEKETATDGFVGIVELTGLTILDNTEQVSAMIEILKKLMPEEQSND